MIGLADTPTLTRVNELNFVREVSEWLASQTIHANTIVWCLNWNNMVVVDSVDSLCTLISALPKGAYAGFKRSGSLGSWAQVRAFEERGNKVVGWPFELHPHHWSLGIPEGVWKLIDSDVSAIAETLWDWVTKSTPPTELPEPTHRPVAGQSFW